MTKRHEALLLAHPLTQLNIETTRRYLACGGSSPDAHHRFDSGTVVLRDLANKGNFHIPLAVCDVCEVPVYGTMKPGYNGRWVVVA